MDSKESDAEIYDHIVEYLLQYYREHGTNFFEEDAINFDIQTFNLRRPFLRDIAEIDQLAVRYRRFREHRQFYIWVVILLNRHMTKISFQRLTHLLNLIIQAYGDERSPGHLQRLAMTIENDIIQRRRAIEDDTMDGIEPNLNSLLQLPYLEQLLDVLRKRQHQVRMRQIWTDLETISYHPSRLPQSSMFTEVGMFPGVELEMDYVPPTNSRPMRFSFVRETPRDFPRMVRRQSSSSERKRRSGSSNSGSNSSSSSGKRRSRKR